MTQPPSTHGYEKKIAKKTYFIHDIGLMSSKLIWIQHPDEAWVPAQVLMIVSIIIILVFEFELNSIVIFLFYLENYTLPGDISGYSKFSGEIK